MILAGALVFVVAAAWYGFRVWRKKQEFETLSRQLRLSLQTLVHALRIGVSFQQALERVARETEEPLGIQWRWLLGSLKVGKPLTRGLKELTQRVPLQEMSWFVAAVCITQQTGGSLAEVLETLSATLQERQSLRDKVSALTAQGKASGILLSALPFVLMAALYVIAPELVTPLFTTTGGQGLFVMVIILVAVGSLVIQKIVSIKVD